MVETTDVFLITGFLGSGKTTLLNRLIRDFPKDKKLMVLMNEFGEIGIDGSLLVGDDFDLLEISKGSIFCVCVKTDFIKALYKLANDVRPDVLVIESTGVANPSDLKRDIKLPIFNSRFVFKEQVCLLDAVHFLDAYQVFSSVEDQISSSTMFIINKTDLVAPERVTEIKKVVASHHAKPIFYETCYAEIDTFKLFKWSANIVAGQGSSQKMTEDELEQYIDKLLANPGVSLKPPDILISATFKWRGKGIKELIDLAEALPPGIPRAKGFVVDAGNTYLFSYVMGQFDLETISLNVSELPTNRLVVIAPPGLMPEVEDIMLRHNCFRL